MKMSTTNEYSHFLPLFTDPKYSCLFDVVIVASGKEIPANKCILAAKSEYFLRKFSEIKCREFVRVEVPTNYNVMYQLVKFMYGGQLDPTLQPHEALSILGEGRILGVTDLNTDDLYAMILPQLSNHTCIATFQHEELQYHPTLARTVANYVGDHFLELILHPGYRPKMLQIPKRSLIEILRIVVLKCHSDEDVANVVKFSVEWANVESACDLLKECKNWPWNLDKDTLSYLKAVPSPEDALYGKGPQQGSQLEWRVSKLRSALLQNSWAPIRIVQGDLFDWHIRIDQGSEGKLRIVYENAQDQNEAIQIACKRFPAAQFAWQILWRGNNVFQEKPVFICFPANVSLHWSTTLPLSIDEISDDDELTIICSLTENPLVSLILAFFSADLHV
eukprot:Platyproteum_vivax@DN4773_c0_g1_i3.p1